MPIACLTCPERGATDRLLAAVATQLKDDGLHLVGALRALRPSDGAGTCDSALWLLPNGPVLDITQDLGAGSAECRMDAGALEAAVGIATTRLTGSGTDLVILNKFGLSETEGRGFRSLIAAAVPRDVAVLVGLPEVHRAAFDSFVDGMATRLEPDHETVLAWCRAHGASAEADYAGQEEQA